MGQRQRLELELAFSSPAGTVASISLCPLRLRRRTLTFGRLSDLRRGLPLLRGLSWDGTGPVLLDGSAGSDFGCGCGCGSRVGRCGGVRFAVGIKSGPGGSRGCSTAVYGTSEGEVLLWAVTGAGKTEMMFPLVERMLAAGRRALVATPRKDVVLELQPRFRAAFPAVKVVTLYGGSAERWETGEVTLATTHQLFRFREAFDLVVLDEVDAFPYHGDPQLAYAAEHACRAGGAFVLLSATPPPQLRAAAERGRLPHAKVCVRFHRHPLPVPVRLRVPPLRRWAARGLPPRLRAAVAASLRRGAQLFVFVPHIAAIPSVVRLLQAAFPETPIGGTSSKDEERGEKVLQFRGKELQVIVTTTILERGVTVPKTDVFILDADHSLFNGASLVQMAGRAGRKLEDPHGCVYFCSSDWTKAQKAAIRDIRDMNALARKKGYLIT
jgi:competence protein ComFA